MVGRSAGYPNSKNHAFLKKLRLKTIIYLCPEDYMVCSGRGWGQTLFGLGCQPE